MWNYQYKYKVKLKESDWVITYYDVVSSVRFDKIETISSNTINISESESRKYFKNNEQKNENMKIDDIKKEDNSSVQNSEKEKSVTSMKAPAITINEPENLSLIVNETFDIKWIARKDVDSVIVKWKNDSYFSLATKKEKNSHDFYEFEEGVLNTDEYKLQTYKRGDLNWRYVASIRYENLSPWSNEYIFEAYKDWKLVWSDSMIIRYNGVWDFTVPYSNESNVVYRNGRVYLVNKQSKKKEYLNTVVYYSEACDWNKKAWTTEILNDGIILYNSSISSCHHTISRQWVWISLINKKTTIKVIQKDNEIDFWKDGKMDYVYMVWDHKNNMCTLHDLKLNSKSLWFFKDKIKFKCESWVFWVSGYSLTFIGVNDDLTKASFEISYYDDSKQKSETILFEYDFAENSVINK